MSPSDALPSPMAAPPRPTPPFRIPRKLLILIVQRIGTQLQVGVGQLIQIVHRVMNALVVTVADLLTMRFNGMSQRSNGLL